MFRVEDIADEAKKLIGVCDDTKLFRWLGDAVSLISNKIDGEGWKIYLDICSAGCHCSEGSSCNRVGGCGRRCITLPREIETVIGVNVGGQPTLGYGQLFNFHINGPGDCKTSCSWGWQDGGNFHVTYRDLLHPAKLVAYLQSPSDNGKTLTIFGYDKDGNVLRRQENGNWLNGYRVPMIYGVAVPDVGAPEIARITGVFKDPTVGSVRLSTLDDSGSTGVLLAVYEPDETLPQYRRIKINRSCNWVRIAGRKVNPTFNSKFDHISLKSRIAFLLAVQARKSYSELQIADAERYEANAVRLELEAQQVSEAPTFSPLQVIDLNNLRDKSDYGIV